MSEGEDISEGDAIRASLLYAFLPFWFVPGALDWYHHRRTGIEATSGTRESLLHLLMFASVGMPVTLALSFEIDETIIGLSALAAAVHEALTLYDVAYAYERRETTPAEQHVHSFLEVMPIAGACTLAAANPRVTARLLKRPQTIFAFSFAAKKRPVPRGYLACFFAAVAAFIVAPYAEEFVRCLRFDPSLGEREPHPGTPRL